MKRLLSMPWVAIAPVMALVALFGTPRLLAAASPASAAPPAQQIGMKVLLITDGTDCTDTNATPGGIADCDWVNTLQREGVRYDAVVTSDASPGSVALPALSSTLSNGTQVADYEGVIVATSGTEGLSTAQWETLQTFEHQFSVRQVTAYAVPSGDYGLGAANPVGGAVLAPTTALTLTADGRNVFPYLNNVALDPTQSTWAYEATPSPSPGTSVDTLISGPNGSSLLGIYTSADGRQTMYQTFNENQYYLQSELLRHGELDWLARNTYFGDQRNYLETDVDDNFLSDDSWNVATHSTDFNPANALREAPSDIVTAANWSGANNFRIDMLFNGGGSVAVADGDSLVGAGDTGSGTTGSSGTTGGTGTGTDPLLASFQATCTSACGPGNAGAGKPYRDSFGWISHTWDHPNIDEGCATQDYIEAELNQNTAWGATAAADGNPISGGLGLTESTDPTAALGTENPSVVITGEHSGIANLLPGNPGQVDPPSLDSAVASTTGGSLPAGQYVYAVTDQFNTALPGKTTVAGTGESAGSVSAPVTVTGTAGSVALTWGAVCHAADYKIYRAPYTGAIGAWALISTVQANTATDFTNPTGNSTSNTAGGGAVEKTFTDTGTETTSAGAPATVGNADESAYEQNPVLDAAFAGTLDGGIKYFGSDASKPYPSPADGSFATGSYTGTEYPAATTFSDAGATAIPRYPTNIYYNVSTNAQEVDEYETLYDSPTCVPITGVTTCNPAGTAFTIAQIVASVDQGMFAHMMGNDPRPSYFHQTNLINQGAPDTALFYETIGPLLQQYHTYFASNAPIEQLTMAQIGTLLTEQAGWAGAGKSQVAGYIQGNVVTVNNSGGAIEIPLTGTTVGSPYAGTQSGWTDAPTGTSTYTTLAAWPAPPTTPAIPVPPTGPAPHPGHNPVPVAPRKPATPAQSRNLFYYEAIQVAPKTVRKKHGTAAVSLKCEAKNGKPAKSHVCTGKFTLKVMGQTVSHKFRIKATKTDRIVVELPKRARAAGTSKKARMLRATLVITTTQPHGPAKVSRGTLNVVT